MLQRVMSQIATVKKDMIILERSEFSALLAENEVCVFINRLKLFPKSNCDIASVLMVVLVISAVCVFDSYHLNLNIITFLPETQDPVIAVQGPTGCK